MPIEWGFSTAATNGPLHVVLVCEGNICRSPLAEQMLRARLGEIGRAPDTVISSAGLRALEGAPMDSIPAEISVLNGGNPEGKVGTRLVAAVAKEADLVLTMTQQQRDEVIQRYPRLMKRAFSLTEFALLLDETPSDIPRAALIDAAARSRGRIEWEPAHDIDDPYRQGREVHEAVGQRIVEVTRQIAMGLSR